MENENSAVAPTGPSARRKLTIVCEIPFVAPNTSGPETAQLVKINVHPNGASLVRIFASS